LTKDKDNYLTKGTAASVASSAYAAVPLPSICPENVSLSVSTFSKLKYCLCIQTRQVISLAFNIT
jgi:hypothetical protein